MAGMKTLRYVVIVTVIAGLGAAGWYGWKQWSAVKSAPVWRTAKVEKGPITASVSATGTLNPVRSVQVGSQVSGQIKEMYVDFNDVVKEGQLLARIDPESFELRVRQAMADVEAARATVATQQAAVGAQRAGVSREEVNLTEARRDYERKKTLFDRGFISTAERDRALALVNTSQEQVKTTRAQLAVSEAQAKNAEAVVKQREAQLAQAQVDLERTAIRAPGEGVIIKRSVDAGQTVAASLQAPELFIIARNLTDMQVEASIDEAEVGRLRLGQRSTFTVDSFPGRIFSGEVLQVRKSARVVQNVVTYIAVIGADNPDQSLLPGMTANVRIITDQRADVLKVPNAALRFRPPGWVDAPARAPAATSLLLDWLFSATLAAEPPAGKGGASQAQQQFRQRLVTELQLDAEQQGKLDAILAAQRERTVAARDLPEGERQKVLAKNRAELRSQIEQMLKAGQKPRFAEIMADLAARARERRVGAATPEAKGAPDQGAPDKGGGPDGLAKKGGAGGSGGGAAAKDGAEAATSGPQAAAAQFRQRLVNELKLDAGQQQRLDQVFASQRLNPQAMRAMSAEERTKAVERNRAELRMRIHEILKPEQRQRYGEILAEIAGRQAARGRVFVLDDKGQPRPVAMRLGLSDGAMTEVLGGELQEGQLVLIGATGGATGGASGAAKGGAAKGGAGKAPGLPL